MKESRSEHMAWCKKRALEELAFSGKPSDAVTSMMSDLGKHPDTAGVGVELCAMMLLTGQIRTQSDARKFIEGFN